jgi:hypothetical protein
MQIPQNMDNAYLLALLQEEYGGNQGKEFKRYDYVNTKSQPRGPLPLPRPPNAAKMTLTSDDKSKGLTKSQSIEDKMATMIAFRMAKGLCKKCGWGGGGWNRTHQCATAI